MVASVFFRFLVIYFFFFIQRNEVSCYSVDKQIYITLSDTQNMCFRILNGTHQFGCSSIPSRISGNVGTVHLAAKQTDVDWIIDKGENDPYIVLLEPDMFKRSVVIKLAKSDKVNGILLIRSNKTLPHEGFSSDTKCPNQYSGMYSNDSNSCKEEDSLWNPFGSGLLKEDLNIPIFLVKKETEIDVLLNKCWSRNKPVNGMEKEFPLCGAELKATMHGVQNSEACLRRTHSIMSLSPESYCSVMGGNNVFTTFKAITPQKKLPERSIIMAMTKMDSTSFFYEATPGANSPTSSVVALLAAGQVLGMQPIKDEIISSDNDIMLTFLDGESFDYIGSSRMAYDMANGKFRANVTDRSKGLHSISLDDIKGIVEISQVGLGVKTNQLYLHTDAKNRAQPYVGEMLKVFNSTAPNVNLSVTEATTKTLPPASLQSFLKHSNKVPGVLIADHDKTFRNQFYHSIYDEAELIDAEYPVDLPENETIVTKQAEHLQKVATLVARALYTMATGKPDSTHIEANLTTVNRLLYCYVHNRSCDLFQSVLSVSNGNLLAKQQNFSLYVGVSYQSSWLTLLTRNLLALYTGEVANITYSDESPESDNDKKCKDLNRNSKDKDEPWFYLPQQGPLVDGVRHPACIKTLANYSSAISPAFVISGYNYSSGEYPTWAESIWSTEIYVKVFMIPSEKLKTVTLSIGVIIFLVSGVIIYFVSKRANILFAGNTSQVFVRSEALAVSS